MAADQHEDRRNAGRREPDEAESRIGMSAEEEQREARRPDATEPADEGVGALTDEKGREPDTEN
ncbi:hypothetical protein [Rothia halotolerans]|uniref:hypothetical protein n=1 Tax=Rothia halotolerans TaxID=405770 RepID=UPI00101BC167|nr:hypothetical protein [Rothia halotolerans]